ncbi:Lrp/AsnC family transcriptional regulator [Rhodococcus erythropolis]|uniref:Lrp/AsnC family transcriptional regulator n=1 Tax=Rhodococcus erythropolis TaxID=1833 RepID=UPI001E51D8D5|nr:MULTISPECIES: Lrp/AsnC family transcriptional regulator [Rhodococcus erythropolis group]MCD2109248.1 Lrp/AsnC family transcriptional regulator [Rhodococcus qingshengii]MCZ4528172.1 Lrp/AsnC family transcriptional regulator [Rhodococcus erythropolis]
MSQSLPGRKPPTVTPLSDDTELDLVAALQIAPRVPISALAEILEQPSTTVNRHFNRLKTNKVIRIVGRVAWPLIASGTPVQVWLRCVPGMTRSVAEELKQFREVQYLMITMGNADIYADVYPLIGTDMAELITSRIPSLSGIASVQSQLVLRSSKVGQSWRLHRLRDDQMAALEAHADAVTEPAFKSIDELTNLEISTLQKLSADARASAADIARETEMSYSTAYRTIQTLLRTGAVAPRLEIEPAAVGFTLSAVVSMQIDASCIPRAMQTLTAHPASRMVTMVAGDTSVICTGVFADHVALASFITDDLGAIDGIRSVSTCVGEYILNIADED